MKEKEYPRIKMANVRLSYPSLFKTEKFGDQDTGKYAATFILDKKEHAETIKQIQLGINQLLKDNLKIKSLQPDRICLRDGDDTEKEENKGKWTIKASTKRKPLVIDRDKAPVSEEDNLFYAGCYVNAIITLWPQDNKYGKRVNASLEGIQYYGPGEPLGSSGLDVDEFNVFGESEELPF